MLVVSWKPSSFCAFMFFSAVDKYPSKYSHRLVYFVFSFWVWSSLKWKLPWWRHSCCFPQLCFFIFQCIVIGILYHYTWIEFFLRSKCIMWWWIYFIHSSIHPSIVYLSVCLYLYVYICIHRFCRMLIFYGLSVVFRDLFNTCLSWILLWLVLYNLKTLIFCRLIVATGRIYRRGIWSV